MSTTVTLEDAKHDFNQLLVRLQSGEEEIIIEEAGSPIARLLPIEPKLKLRVPGCDAGKFVVPPEFFDPLPDEILNEFYK